MEVINDNFSKFMFYNDAIMKYENEIEKIYSNHNLKEYKGYLIDYDEFAKLKEYSNYNSYITRIKYNNRDLNFEDIFNDEKVLKIKKIKKVIFKSAQHLANLILNGNKYLLITEELWKLTGDDKQDTESIFFSIDYTKLIVNLKGEKLYFYHNKNIIDENSLKGDYNYQKYQEYFNEIEKIYYSIKYYCEYEIEFSKKIEDSNYAHLISKKWIDEWKLYSNYDKINDKFLDRDKIEVKNIINELINYFEENENRKKKLSPIILINKKEEIESFLKKDSLVLVNFRFVNKFKQDANFLSYRKKGDIIYFGYDEEKKFKLNKNIIISNGNDYLKNSIEDLKQLIKIYCFQKEIKDLINNESKNIINYNTNINDGIFINPYPSRIFFQNFLIIFIC